jgi:hypothetical protein
VQKGGLDVFPNAAALADQLPALFIRPDHDEQDDVDGEVNYRIIYYFEMIYVKKVVLTTQVEDLLMRDVNLINELLIDNTNLPGYSSGGQIESATVKGVNYNNAYNTGLNMLNPVLRAVVLNIQIKHLTRR